MDHYMNELKVKLKCSQCPQNLTYDSWEQYMGHNSEHVNQTKTSINKKTFLNSKKWIEGIIEYMDSLSTPIVAQNQIHDKFGDYCIVCKRLNVLTPDSQPFFHKSVFANNRISMKSTMKAEVEFALHLRKHLKYESHYYCTLCNCQLNNSNTSNTTFTSAAVDDKCRQHLEAVHDIPAQQLEASDLGSFFGNTKIPDIDSLIPNAVNLFIINCSTW